MKNDRYTPLLFFKEFAEQSPTFRLTSRELKQIYEGKTKQKCNIRTWGRALKKAHEKGYFETERKEQTWIFNASNAPLTEINGQNSKAQPDFSMHPLTVAKKKYHEAHKIRLSTPYHGTQPMEDATDIKPLGRYGTGVQSIYKIEPRITIIAYKNKLNVWIHRPRGTLTKEQMINARVEGFRHLLVFARQHDLKLDGYLEKVLLSHHVVVDNTLNDQLKPLFEQYGATIEERIGSKICPTSHKGHVEHEGRVRLDKVIKGEKVSNGLEYLCLEFPAMHEKQIEQEKHFTAQLGAYALEIEKHREAIKEIKEGIEKFNKTVENLNKLLEKRN